MYIEVYERCSYRKMHKGKTERKVIEKLQECTEGVVTPYMELSEEQGDGLGYIRDCRSVKYRNSVRK